MNTATLCKSIWIGIFDFMQTSTLMLAHLTLQEEKDSGFDEIGIHALSASSFGHAVILWVSMAEKSVNKVKD